MVNQKHWVREMVEMPTRTPRALHIMRSVPGGSGTPSGNVATPLHRSTHISDYENSHSSRPWQSHSTMWLLPFQVKISATSENAILQT